MKVDFFDFSQYEIPEGPFATNSGAETSLVAVIKEEDLVEHFSLLHKILKAVGMDPEKHVTTVKLKEGESTNVTALGGDQLKYVLCFGLKPTEVGFNASFRGYRFYETETYAILFAHSLAALSTSNEKKKTLWGALQKEFKVKS